ncbi:MAG: NnrS protein involved in response to, partial [Deltaproteobacteria bacterium]|nr:NnrS protein involved in response to [Deltaproteobacteria bacterium]
CLLGIDVIVLVILVISGRTFPMFTRNGTGVETIASSPRLDQLTIASMAVLVVLDAVVPELVVTAAWAAVVGVLALVRSWRWGARHTLRSPLLWVLHVGYLWLPIGLVLRAVAAGTGAVSPQIATHALTVGAIGSLTLGMMARVALGHSGRLLAASRPIVVAFALSLLAAVVRVGAPLLCSDRYRITVVLASTPAVSPCRARIVVAIAFVAIAAPGCVRVHAHQRERLASPAMRSPVWPAVTTADEHVFVVREGTAGASAGGGGGCGCN